MSKWSARTRKSNRPAARWKKRPRELALTSKYKSEFLANMSHELRTPLNSILILGQQLADNPDQNLTAKQVDFARTIHGAGTDLLNLISDILDLSKIESGTVTVDAEEIGFANVIEAVARPFRHEADARQLSFTVSLDPALGRTMLTDSKRLQQVLKNLLSNAFKFTAQGEVQPVGQRACTKAGAPAIRCSSQAAEVVAFEVSDTGIGIPAEKQKLIFEAFQQADASHQPQIWRHGPGPGDQPRTVQSSGRRNPAAQHARRGQHLHALSAGALCRRGVSAARPAHARPPAAIAAGARRAEQMLDDRADLRARRHGAADRRGRSPLCPHPDGSGA